MDLAWLEKKWVAWAGDDALVWRDRGFGYGELHAMWRRWREKLAASRIASGSVVVLEGDFSPSSIALLLALVEANAIVVPLARTLPRRREELLQLAEAEWILTLDEDDALAIQWRSSSAGHPHYQEIQRRGHPGLVLFSSGSSGKVKAAVHDFAPLLARFETPGKRLRAVSFLLYDHIGGLNTLLYTIANGGCLVTLEGRDPDVVLAAVSRHAVALLPTSPTFLRLALMKDAFRRYDMSALETITYGTEPMPAATLERLAAALPAVSLRQTYGLSEVGILPSRSESSSSLWLRLGGAGFGVRVAGGILQIQAPSAMLGYLNAPSPWTADGWFDTGDAVEQNGEFYRILGRRSEMINVGGEKVYPAEVESAIQTMPEVADVAVFGQPNPITGMMVVARVQLEPGAVAEGFSRRLKAYLAARLERFKIPVKIELAASQLHSDRYKKVRLAPQPDSARGG